MRGNTTTPANRKATTMTIQPETLPAVGDILVSSWGYDQTNIDYYQVTRVSPAMITMRPIASRQDSDDGGWTGRAVPVPGQFTGPGIRRKPRNCRDGYCVTLTGYSAAHLWDGTPNRYSTYA